MFGDSLDAAGRDQLSEVNATTERVRNRVSVWAKTIGGQLVSSCRCTVEFFGKRVRVADSSLSKMPSNDQLAGSFDGNKCLCVTEEIASVFAARVFSFIPTNDHTSSA